MRVGNAHRNTTGAISMTLVDMRIALRLPSTRNPQQTGEAPMKNLMGRRELLAAGLGLGASLAAGAAFAQQPSQVAPRESGTDALGRRIGGPPEGGRRQLPKRKAKTTQLFLTPPG